MRSTFKGPPKLSISTPVFNGENYLEELLINLQNQSFDENEIVICDNASTDRTLQVCAANRPLAKCPICSDDDQEPFLTLPRMPVLCNVLHTSEASAQSVIRGDITLVVCGHCALIYNASFDPALVEYEPGYENPLHGSAVFRDFADQLSRRLVMDYGLVGGRAVEIGCGDGFFLERLVESGMRDAVGYDPSMRGRIPPQRQAPPLRIVPETFDKYHATELIDAIICRHVLEHVPNPASFLAHNREMVGDSTPLVYFEVPNAEWMLEAGSLWDVIYEHFTYWTPETLRAFFTVMGFTPVSVRTGFGDQFLMLEARPSICSSAPEWTSPKYVLQIVNLCRRFGENYKEHAASLRKALERLKAAGADVVAWGAGSKGVSVANAIVGDEPLLTGIVDVNPSKQGKYVGGCAVPVLSPEQLKDFRPDIVLITNDNYHAEVLSHLHRLGLEPEVWRAGCSVDHAANIMDEREISGGSSSISEGKKTDSSQVSPIQAKRPKEANPKPALDWQWDPLRN